MINPSWASKPTSVNANRVTNRVIEAEVPIRDYLAAKQWLGGQVAIIKSDEYDSEGVRKTHLRITKGAHIHRLYPAKGLELNAQILKDLAVVVFSDQDTKLVYRGNEDAEVIEDLF